MSLPLSMIMIPFALNAAFAWPISPTTTTKTTATTTKLHQLERYGTLVRLIAPSSCSEFHSRAPNGLAPKRHARLLAYSLTNSLDGPRLLLLASTSSRLLPASATCCSLVRPLALRPASGLARLIITERLHNELGPVVYWRRRWRRPLASRGARVQKRLAASTRAGRCTCSWSLFPQSERASQQDGSRRTLGPLVMRSSPGLVSLSLSNSSGPRLRGREASYLV